MSNGKGFMALWCVAEPATCEAGQAAKAFQDQFKKDIGQVDAILRYTATHATAEAHGTVAAKREKAFAAYQQLLKQEEAGQQKKVEAGIPQVLGFMNKLTAQTQDLQDTTEAAFKKWGALADTYVETARRIDEMEAWGFKKAQTVLQVTGHIDAKVVARDWAGAVETLEALAAKLEPIYAGFEAQSAAKDTYEQDRQSFNDELAIYRNGGHYSEVMDSAMADLEDALGAIDGALAKQDYVKANESLTTARDALVEFKEAMNDPDRTGYLDNIKAFEKRLEAAPVPPTEILDNELGEIEAAHQEMLAYVEEAGDFGTAYKLLNETTERLGAFETNAMWDQEELLNQYGEALAKIEGRLEEVSDNQDHKDLKDIAAKVFKLFKEMQVEAKDECYDLALDLAERVNQEIDLFMGELEKTRAATDADEAAAPAAGQSAGDTKTAKQLKAKKSEYEKIRGGIWDRLNGIQVDGEREDLKKDKDKIDKVIDSMEAKAEDEDYDAAIDLANQVNTALDGYVAERDRKIADEKKRAEEILGALQTEYDSVAGTLAQDKQVQDMAKQIRIMLGDMRSLIASREYKHVALNEPEASKLLGELAPLNSFRLADKEVEACLSLFSMEANRKDAVLKKHSDKACKIAPRFDKLGEKGDYKGALKVAEQIKAEAELFRQRLEEIETTEKSKAVEGHRALRSEFDSLTLFPDKEVTDQAKKAETALEKMNAAINRHDYQEGAALYPETDKLITNLGLLSDYKTVNKEVEDCLGVLSLEANRKDKVLNAHSGKASKIAAQMDKLANKGDYPGATKLAEPFKAEFALFEQRLQEIETREKSRAIEGYRSLDAEFDPSGLFDDKEVKALAEKIKTGLAKMEAEINRQDYKKAVEFYDPISKDLGDLDWLSQYKAANKDVEDILGETSLAANRTDKALNKHSDKIGGWAAKMDTLGEKADYQGALKLAEQIKAEYILFQQVLTALKDDEKEFSQTIYPELKGRYDAVAADLAASTEVQKFAKETDKAIQLMYAEMCRHDYKKAKEREPEARQKLEKLEGLNGYHQMEARVQERLGEVSMNSAQYDDDDLKKADKALWALVKKIDTAAGQEKYAAAIALEDSLNQAIDLYLETYKKVEASAKWLLEEAIPAMKDNFRNAWDVPLPSSEMRALAASYEKLEKSVDACMRAKDYAMAETKYGEASEFVFKLIELGKNRDRIKLLKAYETLTEKLEGSEKPDDERLVKDQAAIQAAYDEAKSLAEDGDFKKAAKQIAKVNKMVDAYDAKAAKLADTKVADEGAKKAA